MDRLDLSVHNGSMGQSLNSDQGCVNALCCRCTCVCLLDELVGVHAQAEGLDNSQSCNSCSEPQPQSQRRKRSSRTRSRVVSEMVEVVGPYLQLRQSYSAYKDIYQARNTMR